VAEGSDFIVEFTVAGLPVIGLNAGPELNLDEAFSFYLSVDTQIDRSVGGLGAGASQQR